MHAAVVLLALAAKPQPQPSKDCIVTSIYPDGTEIKRDCFELKGKELAPGCAKRVLMLSG